MFKTKNTEIKKCSVSCLIKDSWILIAASAFNLSWNDVLVEVQWKKKNLASHGNIVDKRRSILSFLRQLCFSSFYHTKTQEGVVS